jgi:dihydrofolate reductase
MRKLILFMHTSLDGFVAGPNGEMDWINVDDEIFDYVGHEVDKADMALYGRVTYQMMEGYWPTAGDQPDASKHDKHHSSWYNKVAKVVLSRTMKGMKLNNTTIISDNLVDEIKKIKAMPGNDIIIFGSPSAAHSLMAENLIDDYWLFVNPILLAKGIPLFSGIKDITKLKLLLSHSFTLGVVCLHYESNPGE